MGQHSIGVDIVLPREALVGEEGKGFSYALGSLNAERILVCSESIGDGRWFVEYSVLSPKTRGFINLNRQQCRLESDPLSP